MEQKTLTLNLLCCWLKIFCFFRCYTSTPGYGKACKKKSSEDILRFFAETLWKFSGLSILLQFFFKFPKVCSAIVKLCRLPWPNSVKCSRRLSSVFSRLPLIQLEVLNISMSILSLFIFIVILNQQTYWYARTSGERLDWYFSYDGVPF
jgi:hypothetical protein